MLITRPAKPAMSGSCVTSRIVMPVDQRSWNSAMTSTLVSESRLPVGSSARITFGCDDQRARDRDALLLAARQLVRVVMDAVGEADALERLARPLVALGGGDVRVEQRQLDVLERGGARQQVEALEHEAERLVADARELVGVQPRDLLAVEAKLARRRLVEAAEDVHQRRLARARRAHHRDELALVHATASPRAAPAPRRRPACKSSSPPRARRSFLHSLAPRSGERVGERGLRSSDSSA